MLVVVDQAIIQPMLIHVNAFAPAINVAGRQRMLSQRLTKASLALREYRRGIDRDNCGSTSCGNRLASGPWSTTRW